MQRGDARACALLSGGRGWLMFLRDEGDEGFSSRNTHYEGPADAKLSFLLENGQRDEYPASWTFAADAVFDALEGFVETGRMPSDIEWHDESGDGLTSPW